MRFKVHAGGGKGDGGVAGDERFGVFDDESLWFGGTRTIGGGRGEGESEDEVCGAAGEEGGGCVGDGFCGEIGLEFGDIGYTGGHFG